MCNSRNENDMKKGCREALSLSRTKVLKLYIATIVQFHNLNNVS